MPGTHGGTEADGFWHEKAVHCIDAFLRIGRIKYRNVLVVLLTVLRPAMKLRRSMSCVRACSWSWFSRPECFMPPKETAAAIAAADGARQVLKPDLDDLMTHQACMLQQGSQKREQRE